MAIQVRRNGAWVDNTQEKKRVNGAWVSNSPYKVMKPTISGVPPFTFKSDGENLRDLSMSGQGVQASTPTQQNPVSFEGVGEKTRNWFDRLGTYTAGAYTNLYAISGLDTSKQYTCSTSLARVAGASAASIYLSQTTSASAATNGVWAGEEKTFTPNENGELYVLVRNTAAGGAPAVADDVIAGNITIMLNAGSTVQPFEPYGYKIPITCGGTTTNIYLGSASTTRRIKKLVLTGEETVSSVAASSLDSGAYCFAYLYSNLNMTDIKDYDRDMRVISYPQFMSSQFVTRPEPTTRPVGYVDLYAGQIGANAIKESGGSNWTYNRYIIFCVSGISTINDFKAWLAAQYANGTPVTIWYITNERQTSAVNEPLMKIGTYADELTKTGTGVDIPTVSGSNTLSVGTTVQPSEMSIESISQWV